jgi:hypothetical protein
VIGRVLIIVGILAVINTLFPIFLFENSRNWQTVEGTVTSTKVLGFIMHFRKAITYKYFVEPKEFTNTQIVPRDPWVDEKANGATIPVRYKAEQPKLAIIDHQQVWQSILLSLWNAVWIIAGVIILKRK